MNKIFKVIWNNAKHCYVVASELAKSYSKGRGSRTIRKAVAALGIAVAVFTMPQVARADEIIITNGSVSINDSSHEYDDYYLNGSNITFTLNTNGVVNSISGNSDAAVSGNTVTINGGTVNNVDTDWFEFPAESGNWVSKPKLTGGFSTSGAVIGNQVSITNAALGGNYPSVYGGYSRTGNVSKNVITVESENSNLYVYGGHSETGAVGGDTAADGNIVTVKSGEVNYVVGGFSASQDVKNNKALIEGGTVGNFVAGGLSYGDVVSSNVVNISGSSTTISGTGDHSGVYGGYVEQGSGIATSNSVTISNGTINSSVYGGRSRLGNSFTNTVNISGGTVSSVYGGYSDEGNSTSNSVNISDGSIDTVYGGYVEQGSGNSTSNSVTISSGLINGSVYGGRSRSGNSFSNTVTISGGEVGGSVWGGIVEDGTGDAASNSINISGDSTLITDSVYGGYIDSGSGNATSNSVNISGGNVSYVYGGYVISGSGDSASNSVTISGGEVGGSVWGGIVEDGTGDADHNSVTITNVTIYGSVLGGNVWEGKGDAAADSNSVTINGGTVYGAVYGGEVAEGSGDASRNLVTINEGIVDSVIGGEVWDGSGNATSNSVIISGGTVGSAYGGNVVEGSGDAINNSVNISGGTVNDSVYGGFTDGSGDASNNSVTINGGTVNNVDTDWFEFPAESGNWVSKPKLTGGFSTSGAVIGNQVSITNAALGGNYPSVYGGYSRTGNVSKNVITVESENSNLYVYGGYGETGVVGGDTAADGNIVTIKSGEVYYVVGGHSTSGDIKNNKAVIEGGTVDNFVAGGYAGDGSSDGGAVSSNVVNISGSSTTISGTGDHSGVYGGYSISYTKAVIDNHVTIGDGATVNTNVYGGYANRFCDSARNSVSFSGGTVSSVYGGYSDEGNATSNSVNISGGTFNADSNIYGGYTYNEQGSSVVSDNIVNITGSLAGLDDVNIYGYYFENGSGAHSGNELHIGRAVDYDGEGNIQRDSEENIKYKSDSSTIWHGKSSDSTVNNSINKIANFDTIALHSVAWNNDLPAIKAASLENIGTVDITDLKFYENGSEKTTFELGDKMNLLTWENEKEALIDLKYKLNGTGDEQTAVFSDNPKGITVKTKSVSETNNGISFEGTNTGNINKVDKALEFSFASITLNSVDLSGWDGKNTSEVPSGWSSNANGVNVSGDFADPGLSAGESINILTASTDMFKDENIDEKIRYKNYGSFKDESVNGISISGYQTGGVKASNDGKYLSYYAIKKTADKLTFGDVEWKDQGSLIDHKTMLKDISFDGADIDTTKIAFTNKEKLDANMKMTLVSDFGDSVGTITGTKYKVGTAYEGEGSAYLDGSDLVFKTKTAAGLSDETHTTVMAMEAGVAMLAAGNEQIGNAIEGLGNAANRSSDGISTFASVGGGSSRYETGSHIDTNSWNIAVAVGKNLEKRDGTLEYGLFGEYGRGNYTLHMDGIEDAGSGSTHYTGGGLLLKWTNSHNVYTEASYRMGNMKDKASSLLHDGVGNAYGYDTSAKYRGGHFGIGKICREDNDTKLEVYGKYFYNQREGINFAAGADQYSLEDVRSRVIRAGFRLSSTDKKWNRYGGLAYDYELDGESKGTVNGTQIRSASVKGGTLRGEFGYCKEATKTNPWKTDISLYGFTGKRKGVGGNIAVEYHF